MRSLFALFTLVASASAYQILTPSNSSGWTTGGANNVTWTRVSTDNATFTMVLVNQDKSIMPSGQEVLIATVDGTLGVIAVPPPSGGLPAGNGFQVNFVKDPQDLNTILAQSQQFAITRSNSTTTTSLSNTAVLTPAATANPTQTTDTSLLNPTDSASNTTGSGKNGADRVTTAGGTGLIFAALAAFFL